MNSTFKIAFELYPQDPELKVNTFNRVDLQKDLIQEGCEVYMYVYKDTGKGFYMEEFTFSLN